MIDIKRIIFLGLLFLPCILCNGQDRLQRAVDRYDYKTAINIIDSLVAEIGTDSVAVAQNKETVIDLALQKSRCLRRLYRMSEAVTVLSDVLCLDQFNVELMADLAESHMQAGNSMDAYSLYGLLSQMQPDNQYFKICKARILYREKQYGESIQVCRDLIAKDSIPELMAMTGDAYKNLGNTDSALVYYEHVLRARPGHVPTMCKKADILLADKKFLPVIDMSREYLKNDPDNIIMLPIYGLALHLQGSYPLSIEVFERQRELGDNSYAVNYYLGLNHYMMDKWTKAIEEFEKAYQIDSSDVTLVYQLAHAKSHVAIMTSMTACGLNPESERLYAKAVEMLKPSPKMMHNIYGSMALSRHRKELYEDAIKYYELSYKYDPKNISALSSIGYCYERLKNYTKALEYYENYMKLGKPGSAGYRFVEESVAYVKQKKFMEE